jgi:hypothetical protein
MSGSWNHDQAYYRCKFPTAYAGATGKHPSTVYVREADLLPSLDEWLLSVFDPKNLAVAVAALSAAQSPDDTATARAEAARRAVKDCDGRLAKYRSALEAGADPVVVAGWMSEVQADRLAAERELASTGTIAQPLSEAEIRALVASQRQILKSLSRATPEQRATIYGQTMGLQVTYNPRDASIEIEARPACTQVCVGGGTPTRFSGLQPSPLDRVQGSTSYFCSAHSVDRQGSELGHSFHVRNAKLGAHDTAEARGSVGAGVGCWSETTKSRRRMRTPEQAAPTRATTALTMSTTSSAPAKLA